MNYRSFFATLKLMDNKSEYQAKHSSHHIHASRQTVRALKAKADAKRSTIEKLADWINLKIGSIGFLFINLAIIFSWILINTDHMPGFMPFDTFPFGLLTLILSIEAIMLTIFVLISQNRATHLFDLREEMDLQIDMITEQEITKLLEMQKMITDKLGIDTSKDHILTKMLQRIDPDKIEKSLEKQF